jgi:hypothetical protein
MTERLFPCVAFRQWQGRAVLCKKKGPGFLRDRHSKGGAIRPPAGLQHKNTPHITCHGWRILSRERIAQDLKQACLEANDVVFTYTSVEFHTENIVQLHLARMYTGIVTAPANKPKHTREYRPTNNYTEYNSVTK